MDHELERNRFSQATLLETVKVSKVTFNSWRSRNGLFPRTKVDRKWNYYTMDEILVSRSVVILTRKGFSAQFAVDAAMELIPIFEVLSEDIRSVSARVVAALVDSPSGEGMKWEVSHRAALLDEVCHPDINAGPLTILLDVGRIVLEVVVSLENVIGVAGIDPLYERIDPKPHQSFKAAPKKGLRDVD